MPSSNTRPPRRRRARGQPSGNASSGSISRPQQGPQMLLCNSSNFSVNGSTFNAIQGDMIVHNNDNEEFLRRAVAELRRSLPPVVAYSSPNALIITDALGETLTVPWTLVPTLDALTGLLVDHFRGKIGERRVAARKYCIGWAEGSGGGREVEPDDWEEIRESNARLIMSMLIEQELVKELRELCPKCGKTKLGTYFDDGWQVCRRCNTRFMLPGEPVRGRGDIDNGDLVEEAAFRHVRKREVELNADPQQPLVQGPPFFINASTFSIGKISCVVSSESCVLNVGRQSTLMMGGSSDLAEEAAFRHVRKREVELMKGLPRKSDRAKQWFKSLFSEGRRTTNSPKALVVV
ncbi:hypothetical protein DFP72DRAFT_1046471 [Ephemerocybe angulata]|uniref:Ubiquitin-like domain-containing protein n=1 Tax=Ephemerocybe angulata TaxID=980116 RepID=A0A8H6M3X9_9AGAR|nr:hypothetical protein DFP72DRAFT_1046471 [Tulosesus angulatus]